jgi:hypothetical protein
MPYEISDTSHRGNKDYEGPPKGLFLYGAKIPMGNVYDGPKGGDDEKHAYE